MNNQWFIVTNRGYIMTNDEKMSHMEFTIDEMIADNTLLDDPGGEPHHVYVVTKNRKDYWDNELGFVYSGE